MPLDPGHQGLEPDVHGGVVHSAALRHVAPAAASQAQQDVSALMWKELGSWGSCEYKANNTKCKKLSQFNYFISFKCILNLENFKQKTKVHIILID